MEEGVVNEVRKVKYSQQSLTSAPQLHAVLSVSVLVTCPCSNMTLHPTLLTVQGRLGGLFDAQQLLTDVSGSGNNWAHGHHLYGPQYRDNLLESIRRPVEACESLQSFLLLQSLGGGTGSGLGCYILNLLEVCTVSSKSKSLWPGLCIVM